MLQTIAYTSVPCYFRSELGPKLIIYFLFLKELSTFFCCSFCELCYWYGLYNICLVFSFMVLLGAVVELVQNSTNEMVKGIEANHSFNLSISFYFLGAINLLEFVLMAWALCKPKMLRFFNRNAGSESKQVRI